MAEKNQNMNQEQEQSEGSTMKINAESGMQNESDLSKEGKTSQLRKKN